MGALAPFVTPRRVSHAAVRVLAPPLLPARSAPAPAVAAVPRRIAIVRTDARIGNLVTITALLDPIARTWPQSHVTLVCAEALRGLVTADPAIHGVIGVDRARLWRNPAYALARVRSLRAVHADVAIDASHTHAFSTTDALLLRATAAPVRIGFDRGEEAACASHLVPVPAGTTRPEAYRTLLAPLGVRPDPPASRDRATAFVRLAVRDADRRAAEAWWGERTARRVLVHTGGRGAKRWPLDRWREAAAALHAVGYAVALACDPPEHALVRDALRTQPFVRVCPVVSLARFTALVATSDVYVGADAGPAHLAAATGVPRAIVFLEETTAEWAYGADHLALVGSAGPSAAAIVEAVRSLVAEWCA